MCVCGPAAHRLACAPAAARAQPVCPLPPGPLTSATFPGPVPPPPPPLPPPLQLAGHKWTWQALNTLCWAIGSISGSMQEEQENRFLVRRGGGQGLVMLC